MTSLPPSNLITTLVARDYMNKGAFIASLSPSPTTGLLSSGQTGVKAHLCVPDHVVILPLQVSYRGLVSLSVSLLFFAKQEAERMCSIPLSHQY